MIMAMYISSVFFTLATVFSESTLSVVFINLAFISALVADYFWSKTQSKIKSLEKALEKALEEKQQ